eukprot:872121-Pleurochrysis_carterae.AAC.1
MREGAAQRKVRRGDARASKDVRIGYVRAGRSARANTRGRRRRRQHSGRNGRCVRGGEGKDRGYMA